VAGLPDLNALLDRLPDLPAAARLPLLALVAATVGWFVVLGLVMLATRPLPVGPGPATQDLQGDEPPAVVSLLANEWAVTEDAAESTLLDLAARGYLELRQPDADPRHTTVHVTADNAQAAASAAARQARVLRATGGPVELTDYERQVLDHVGRIAVGGVVPLTALTFRDQGTSARWASRFESSVISDARRRGLIRRRVPAWVATAMGALAAAPGLAFSWTAWELDHRSDARSLLTGVIPLVLLSSHVGRPRGHRGTAKGRETAARWLGLRRYLAVDKAFGELPPSAVAVWDRYLAYGDALGVTHVSSAVIDLGMANRERVWSSFGGHWHQVQVRYPMARARYGTTALRLIVTSLLCMLAGYGLLRLFGVSTLTSINDRWDAVLLLLPITGAALALLGGYRLLRTLVDLLAPRTLHGEVLWVAVWRSQQKDNTTFPYVHYLAVDDGSSDRTTAWALPESATRGFGPGDVIELTVRPWSRRVTAVSVLHSRGAYGPDISAPAVGVSAATPGVISGDLITAQELSSWLGVPLTANRVQQAGLQMDAWVFRPTAQPPGPAGSAGPAVVGAATGVDTASGVDPAGAANAVTVSAGNAMIDRLLLRAHRHGQPVPGLGEEAYLTERGAIARQGDMVVRIALTQAWPVSREALIGVLGTALSRLPRVPAS
jgi:hypothetical protein